MINNIWKDPVWSKVIASGIMGLIVLISNYYLNWWIQFKEATNTFFTYLNNYTEIQNWIIVLMSICSIIVIIFIIAIIWNLIFQKKEQTSWENYKEDNFYGLEWHWSYNMFDKQPEELYTLCPHCKYQLYPNEQEYPTLTLNYNCENCNTKFQTINLLYSNLKHKIILNIQQKLRTGTYKKNT